MQLVACRPQPVAATPALRPPPQPAGGVPPVAAGRSQRLAALGQCLLRHLDTPLLVTDAEGTLFEANAAAAQRTERCDGLWIDAAGRLAVRQGGRWVPIVRWAAEVGAGRSVTLALEGGDVPQQLTLTAMRPGEGGYGASFWMLARIESARLTLAETMQRRFRFTPAQARLAEMLCQGMRPAHAAQALGVKISTVRTHVGELYEKTGTRSQAQRVARLHGG